MASKVTKEQILGKLEQVSGIERKMVLRSNGLIDSNDLALLRHYEARRQRYYRVFEERYRRSLGKREE